ncbi:MAG: ATP-dependent DNA ligase [Asgard group archaeon]|nr:ATP-dependent DNA ligase [Asgard group archaeon]
MQFNKLAKVFNKLENTTKRLVMLEILVELFKEAPTTVLKKVVYLTSGKISPDYEDVDFGIAEKMVVKAIAKAMGTTEKKIDKSYRRLGDLGSVAEEQMQNVGQKSIDSFFPGGKEKQTKITVTELWEKLHKIAKTEGKGAINKKIKYLLGLYSQTSPIESKYLTRIILSQLRLGVKDLSIIEALSQAFSDRPDAREIIEHAYNIRCDIGEVAEVLAKKGLMKVANMSVQVGRPIRMMAAQRMNSIEEILEKLGGKCALEYKYDGERVQAHITNNQVKLFSRNLNDISNMYPDICKELIKAINSNDIIIEGEITAWDTEKNNLKPFQTLMIRKRKYGIEKAIKNVPVKVFLFDVLYKNGQSLLSNTYQQRREILKNSIISKNHLIEIAKCSIVSTPNEFENVFQKAINYGCEGVMAKELRDSSIYQAGNRGFLWIKHKFDYTSTFADSYDFVVVGGFYGKGRRKGTLGTLLMAAYNPIKNVYETVCKLGSGFSDENLQQITNELEKLKANEKPKDVSAKIEPDIWIYPDKVYEVQGADLSTSPVHTCALDEIQADSGIAIRFPRFIRFREDKNPEQITTSDEIINAYKKQRLMNKQ